MPVSAPEHDDRTRRRRILVVDDEQSVREMIAEALGELYDIDQAASGAEAIEKVKEQDYDLLMIDLRMPGFSGRQLCEWAANWSRRSYHGRMLLLTGDVYEPESQESVEGTGYPCLLKPFKLEQMESLVESILTRVQSNEPSEPPVSGRHTSST